MKQFVTVLAMGILCAATALPLAAQSRPAEKRAAGDRPREAKALEQRFEELSLTEEQKPQVRQILDTYKQSLANWQSENGAKMRELETKLKEALKARDQDAVKSVREEIKALQDSRKSLLENVLKQLGDVLTPEQMAKAKNLLTAPAGGDKGFRNMPGLQTVGLTEEQKKQAREILEAAHAKAQQAKGKEAKEALWQEAFEKIRTTVLNDEQRNKLDQMKKRGDFFQTIQKLNLTEEQKAKIAEIHKDTEAKVAKATTPQEKRDIINAALKKINTEVLTKAQQAQLKKERPVKAARKAATLPASQPTTQKS